MNRAAVEGYWRLGALARPWPDDPGKSCRPFDRDRSGFVVGEGAGALVLESEASVKARSGRVRGWILGAASTCDAGSPVAPDPKGLAAERCVRRALERAGVRPADLMYVNTHGTGTPLNDRVEAEVLARVLGQEVESIPCGSFKSMLGHLAMACGLVELIGCLPTLIHGHPPMNQNLVQPDVPVRVMGWRDEKARRGAVLKVSFGFGGMNTAVVVSGEDRVG
ncbi:MAG: beta-ketoacyl synthase N-terminal-like domain-containing protein [Verrucomicrobiia bacterium]